MKWSRETGQANAKALKEKKRKKKKKQKLPGKPLRGKSAISLSKYANIL